MKAIAIVANVIRVADGLTHMAKATPEEHDKLERSYEKRGCAMIEW